MSTGINRRIAAWSLLVLMVSMLTFSALHVHRDVLSGAEECYQCAHHQHHSGHFSEGGVSLHDCVLCQFVATPYVAAVILMFVPLLSVRYSCQTTIQHSPCRMAWGVVPSRAPPVSIIR